MERDRTVESDARHPQQSEKRVEHRAVLAIRFAGDSGDGMQLAGDRFANVSAVFGNDVATLADYPAEIRAPSGTVFGVSGYQLNFGSQPVYTPGDLVDILIAMNPAALKANLSKIKPNGMVIVDCDAFNARSLQKAGFVSNPLEDGSLNNLEVYSLPITTQSRAAVESGQYGAPLSPKAIDRCKNFYALGVTCWLTGRPTKPTMQWLANKFKRNLDFVTANQRSFIAGFDHVAASSTFKYRFEISPDQQRKQAGTYRYVNGNETIALGLIAAAEKANLKLFLGSYPITPATDILQEISKRRCDRIITFQAEDEIAGIGTALGAAYAGALGVTSTSGPGLALKSEFINLAVMTELPLVIIDVQRAGPSTGMPTKTEQSDLLQAMFGRNGDSPVVVMACRSPVDGFATAFEACRIALKYMTPVIVLSDGYLANGSEPWQIPAAASLPEILSRRITSRGSVPFLPYERDEVTLARHWAIPGTPELEHRIGGLEKEDRTGKVSHDQQNHERMTKLRADKVARVESEIPPCDIYGDPQAKTILVGWGSTYGAMRLAVEHACKSGKPVAGLHLRFLNPLPKDLGGILRRYDRIIVPENNMGQLTMILRAKYLLDIESFSKVQGAPFTVEELLGRLR